MTNLQDRLAAIKSRAEQCTHMMDNDVQYLLALVENYREALEFSKSGCLVPPDGGQPKIQDHIDNATQALKKGEEMAAEYERA